MIRIALGIVKHRIVTGAVAERKHRPFPDLTGYGSRLTGLATFYLVQRSAKQHRLLLAHVVIICRLITLRRGNIGYIRRDHMIQRNIKLSNKRPDNFTLAGGNHPYVKTLYLQILDHLEHRPVERLSVSHALKADRIHAVSKVLHIGAKLLRCHAGKGRCDHVVFGKALRLERLAFRISVVPNLLHGILLFLARAVRRIIEHTVHCQAVVKIDRCLLAEDGTIHVKGRYAVSRIKILRTGLICDSLNKLYKLVQRRTVRIPGWK